MAACRCDAAPGHHPAAAAELRGCCMPRETPQLSQADVSAGPSRVPRPARWWRWLGYGGLVLLLLTATVPWRVGVPDTYIQMKTGQYILEQGIPHRDPFSFMSPAAGHGYVEHEWLACILFYLRRSEERRVGKECRS